MNEQEARAAVRDAESAKQLLDNPLLDASVEALRKQYLDEWSKTEPGDITARERLHVAYNMVPEVFAHLRVVVSDGVVASAHLKKLQKS